MHRRALLGAVADADPDFVETESGDVAEPGVGTTEFD